MREALESERIQKGNGWRERLETTNAIGEGNRNETREIDISIVIALGESGLPFVRARRNTAHVRFKRLLINLIRSIITSELN